MCVCVHARVNLLCITLIFQSIAMESFRSKCIRISYFCYMVLSYLFFHMNIHDTLHKYVHQPEGIVLLIGVHTLQVCTPIRRNRPSALTKMFTQKRYKSSI